MLQMLLDVGVTAIVLDNAKGVIVAVAEGIGRRIERSRAKLFFIGFIGFLLIVMTNWLAVRGPQGGSYN